MKNQKVMKFRKKPVVIEATKKELWRFTNAPYSVSELCTHTENMRNQKLRKTSVSGSKGVSWYRNYNKWSVKVGRLTVGYYNSLDGAINAYNLKSKELFGEFASLNKINGGTNA